MVYNAAPAATGQCVADKNVVLAEAVIICVVDDVAAVNTVAVAQQLLAVGELTEFQPAGTPGGVLEIGVAYEVSVVEVAGRDAVRALFPCTCCTVNVLYEQIVGNGLIEEAIIAVLDRTVGHYGVVDAAVDKCTDASRNTGECECEFIEVYVVETACIAVLHIQTCVQKITVDGGIVICTHDENTLAVHVCCLLGTDSAVEEYTVCGTAAQYDRLVGVVGARVDVEYSVMCCNVVECGLQLFVVGAWIPAHAAEVFLEIYLFNIGVVEILAVTLLKSHVPELLLVCAYLAKFCVACCLFVGIKECGEVNISAELG